MVVQHNMNALNAYNKLNTNVAGLKKSSEKLASGYRINRAGDDAAGLAISEKMRSQIKGLNQAVRNSQDGINMIQTYEGAAQESHNILRRMKELASEAANGTYQNEVDRDAVQLEFNQLNDELNQIADTDFNGVVMLNGGQMADGTLQVNGKFNYAKGDAVAPSKLSKNDVNILDNQGFNNSFIDTTDPAKPVTVKYADSFWNTLNPQWSRTDGDASNDGPESVDITFKYDKASGSWKTISATNGANYNNVSISNNGNGGFSVVSGINTLHTYTYKKTDGTEVAATGVTADNVGDNWYIDKTNGDALMTAADYNTGLAAAQAADGAAPGTSDTYKTNHVAVTIIDTPTDVPGATLADVVLDESVLANGDTITLTFKNPASGISAPQNSGAAVAVSSNITEVIGAEKAIDLDLAVKTGTGFDDSKMSADINELLNELDGADVKVSYEKVDETTYKSSMVITLNDGTVIKSGADGATTKYSVNGSTFDFKWEANDTATLADDDATNDKSGKFTISIGAQEIMTITAGGMKGVDVSDAKDGSKLDFSTGNITYKIGLDDFKYNAGAVPSVEVAKTGNVSKANSNTAANAPLTYTDHIVLQTGARTKDSVDFTMEYSTEGMGDLKANLNISSRADGLNTANLSLNTQEDANYAIDRIDNAINKVSMVRATFGATQNRLEHKIDNLTTTAENIQEAESSIRDTDMASEMMNYTKFNILQQAAQSMLAQANQQPQSILQLLG